MAGKTGDDLIEQEESRERERKSRREEISTCIIDIEKMADTFEWMGYHVNKSNVI